MTIYQFANNASATLGSAVSPTDTSFTLATGTGAEFPNPSAGEFFTATLWAAGSTTGTPNEIVKCTNRVGDTLTVVRAQEGTTAQAWAVGDTVANYITAGFLNQLVDANALQEQTGNYAIDTGTANAVAVALLPTVTSYTSIVGTPIRIKKGASSNTDLVTINVNGLGPVTTLLNGIGLEGGELAEGVVFTAIHNGVTFDIQSSPAIVHTSHMAPQAVTNAILAPVPPLIVKGNLTSDETQPYDIPLSDLANALNLQSGWNVNDRIVAGADDVVVPAGIYWAWVIIVAGGGSGQGGGSNYTGGGAGAGGVAMGKVPVTPGATIHRIVGAGGATAAANTPGNNGGTSSLSGIGQATGGQGAGSPGLQAGGYGGVGSSLGPYLRTFQGGDGEDGSETPNASVFLRGGQGAPGYLGMGGGRSGAGAGQPGVSPGAGGGGGYAGPSTGGAGRDGAVYIEWLTR